MKKLIFILLLLFQYSCAVRYSPVEKTISGEVVYIYQKGEKIISLEIKSNSGAYYKICNIDRYLDIHKHDEVSFHVYVTSINDYVQYDFKSLAL